MQHFTIHVFGRVQGVSFRYFTKLTADTLGLTGWVRNETDGSVLIEVEGDAEQMRAFLDWLTVGPRSARVEKITKQGGTLTHFTGFDIR